MEIPGHFSAEINTKLAETGFGQQVRQSLVQRANWMMEEGLFKDQGNGTFSYDRNLQQHLTARELKDEGARLARQLGKAHTSMRPFEEYRGVLKGTVTLNSGKYALVERARDFALVPWRDVLERHIGKEIGGMVRGSGSIDWTLGRDRGLNIGM